MSKKFIKDGIFLLLAKFFSVISGVLVAVFVARYYGVNIYGEYTTAITFSTFILTFTDLGFDTYMLKECSRDRTNLSKYYSNIILLKCLILFLSIILIIFLSINLGYNQAVIKLIIILLPNLIIGYILNTFFVIMQLEDKLDISAKIQMVQNSLVILTAIFAVILKLSIYIYAMLQNGISVLLLIIYKVISPVKFKISIENSKKLVFGSILFGLSSLLYIIYFKIDTVMLSLYKGTYEVGIYESAYKAVNIIISMIAILDNIVMPKFFLLYKNNKNKMIEIYEELLKYGLIFGVPVSIVLMYLSKFVINILYGKAYNDSVLILEILVWTICIRLMAVIAGFVITASDNMCKKVKFQLCFAIFNIAINIFLIPNYGVKGAAVSSVITELMVFLVYLIFVKRNFKVNIKISYIVKSIVANMILIIFLSFFHVNFVLMAIICVGAYILVIGMFFRSELLKMINIIFSSWQTRFR